MPYNSYGGNQYGNRSNNGYSSNHSGGGWRNNQNGQNNQNAQNAENTIGAMLTNNAAGKFLQMDFYGKTASITIGTNAPGTPMDWTNRRNAKLAKAFLSYSELCDMLSICEEVQDSIKNAGTFTSAGIISGSRSDTLVEINNGSTLGMGPGIYLVIYKGLDTSKRAMSTDVYPFDVSKILRGYDPSSGMMKEDISKVGQFKKFIRYIKEAANVMTMAYAHTVATANSKDKLAVFRAMSAIASKLGVDVSADLDITRGGNRSNGGSRSYSNSNNGSTYQYRQYGNTPAAAAQAATTAMAAMNDPVDINLTMEDLATVSMTDFK